MEDFFGIGIFEILVILVVAVIALGPDRMVEVGRTLGKWMNSLKKMGSDLTMQVTKEVDDEKRPRDNQPLQNTVSTLKSTPPGAAVPSTKSEIESIKALLAAAEARLKIAEAAANKAESEKNEPGPASR